MNNPQVLIQTPNTPIWMALAAAHLGVSEVKGKSHATEVLSYWKDIKRSGIKDDETAWCAAFVGAKLERAGKRSTRFESAASYELWGTRIAKPVQGAVAVLSHHVAFVAGIRSDGRMMLLGGNQGDAVTIAAFDPKAIKSYRWPKNTPVPADNLPVYKTSVLAKNETVKIT
jgi:uncharacterized protein (TIGR02594 family)